MRSPDTMLLVGITMFLVFLSGTLRAAITPEIELSRTTGVAPLAVFVDATTSGGLDGGDYINANFAWDFDGTGTDPTGKYTVTRGFVAAHVYETPGTYTIELTVHDRLGNAATATAQVVVTAFDGTTYYVADGGSDSAAGTSMDAPLATPDYAITNKSGPNTRILIRRGDRFTVPIIKMNDKAGPGIVGSYTDPDNPSDELPILFCDAEGWGMFYINGTTNDWRFMDVHLRSMSDNRDAVPSQGGIATGLSTANLLFLRMEIDSVSRGALGIGNTLNSFAFDCYCHDYGVYMTYAETVNRLALVGNISRRKSMNPEMVGSPEHLIRFQGGSKAVIAYNDAADGKSNYDEITIRGSTSQVYVLQNRFDQMLTIHPQNSGSEEYQTYCVVDGNLLRSGGVRVTAKHIAVRNNLLCNNGFNLSSHALVGISDDVAIYNNSCYGSSTTMVYGSATNTVIKNNIFHTTAMEYASGISMSNSLDNYQIDNNIYYAPNISQLLFSADGINGFNSFQAAGADVNGMMADPQFVSVDLSSPDFLKLDETSPARSAGAMVPVFCDFDGALRTAGQITDAGARLFGVSGVPKPALAIHGSCRMSVGTRVYDLLGRVVTGRPYNSGQYVSMRIFQGGTAANRYLFYR